jgi:hypothetical protein
VKQIRLEVVVDGNDVRSTSAVNIPIYVTALAAGASSSADKSFTQAFTNQSSVTVNHNLSKRPAVTVIDSAGDEVAGQVTHNGTNSLTIVLSDVNVRGSGGNTKLAITSTRNAVLKADGKSNIQLSGLVIDNASKPTANTYGLYI